MMELKKYITLFAVLLCTLYNICTAIQREFYIGLVEEEWDFAPQGNLLHKNDKNSYIYLENDPSIPTIGRKYKKAMYRQFTDDTFTTKVDRPEYMGMLGPFLHSEIGDHLVIHFHNMAKNFNYSMHPHGLFYNKDSEGALYVDNTNGSFKYDDAVLPGMKYTYVWIVRPEYGPTADDPNCITWLIHSHQFAEVEMMSGAILIMATCKRGTLDENGKRKDVDREYPLLFMIFDENLSPYIGENQKTYLPENFDSNGPNISITMKGNKMHSINGYLYGNLQGLEACENERISFHIAVVGNDDDVHSVYIQGHTMTVYNHRYDTLGVYPGDSLTAMLTADNVGKWLVSSQNVLYEQAGMQTLFTVKPCNKIKTANKKPSLHAKVRRYFIAAEEIWWNYAPSGYNLVTGVRFEDEILTKNSFGKSSEGNCKLNGRYKKVVFKAYTDVNFRKPLKNSAKDLGLLGPPIKAEVGDVVKISFYNKATRNYSIQAYRFFVDYDEHGIKYDGGPDVDVIPGAKKQYTWRVPESAGPTLEDPDCLLGRYYSAVDVVKDTYSGLSGPLLVCRKGMLDLRGKNLKVNKEFYLMFSDFREKDSHYFKESVLAACPDADYENLMNDAAFEEANTVRSLNGYLSGNLPGLTMCRNDKVNWYVMSVGSGMDDIHSPHFHGNTFLVNDARKDSITLTADIFHTLYMIPDNPGIWILEDQITLFDQHTNQMDFLYEVKDCSYNCDDETLSSEGKVRTYYIAAVEKTWDYAPVNLHPVALGKLSENPDSKLYYNNDPAQNMIGHLFKKALYREFTDATFTEEKVRTTKENHLGFMGPFIKAEVGDTIKVVFKNLASFNFSIIPHGVFYTKANEGAIYNDSVPVSKKQGGSVAPGESFTYVWSVPERAGPGPDDFNCVTWAYTSHVNYNRDIYSTLIGPLIVCRKGILDENGKRLDLDEEYALLFFINNEGASAYINDNIRTYLQKEPSKEIFDDITFQNSNDKLGINGYIYANIPDVTILLGERTAWYLLSLGETRSTHTVHWHGNTFVRRVAGFHRHDVMDALPGDFGTVEMDAVNKGTWLMHCHVNNHSHVGMEMVYTVIDPDDQINHLAGN